jgi:hypothetical protein
MSNQSDYPIFSIGDRVRLAHGIDNSEGYSNPDYFPSCDDKFIGRYGRIENIVASNGKWIEATYNKNMNRNLKLLVEFEDDLLASHRRFHRWVKAVDVVNYDLNFSRMNKLFHETEDKDLQWKDMISRMNIWDFDNSILQSAQLVRGSKTYKKLHKETYKLATKAKKLYKIHFYHLVEAKRIHRWKCHVEVADERALALQRRNSRMRSDESTEN